MDVLVCSLDPEELGRRATSLQKGTNMLMAEAVEYVINVQHYVDSIHVTKNRSDGTHVYRKAEKEEVEEDGS